MDEIFDDEEFHLIEVKKKVSNVKTTDQRLIESFEEIKEFVEKNGKEPEPNTNNVTEFQLYSRLKGIREDYAKLHQLSEYDTQGLLPVIEVNEEGAEYSASKKPEKLEDIFDDDEFSFLEDNDEGLFEFKHVPKETERASADFVARRKPCPDFELFDHLFKDVHKDLSSGQRKLVNFRQGNLREGGFYVHNGVLFYLYKINISQEEHYKLDGTRVREDGRTRCIFENGTESNMLKRSVEKILYANGRVITENTEIVNKEFQQKFSSISEVDEDTGYIYVLSSKSEDPQIAFKEHLYKIGYSRSEVPERIKNASKEPTYLMAPVVYVAGWKCYNMNPQKFEHLLHKFFVSSCLDVDVFDENGTRHTPREWFIVPLGIIEQTVQLIISGEITKYRYDPELVAIVEK